MNKFARQCIWVGKQGNVLPNSSLPRLRSSTHTSPPCAWKPQRYRRLRSKLAAPKAITAMAHRLARLVYRMLKYGQQYVDKGAEYYRAKESPTTSRVSQEESRSTRPTNHPCWMIERSSGESCRFKGSTQHFPIVWSDSTSPGEPATVDTSTGQCICLN